MSPAPTGLGLTVTMPGGGFSAVCLRCGSRLRLRTRLRSAALVALSIHDEGAHP